MQAALVLGAALVAGCGTSGRDRPTVEVTARMSGEKQVADVSLHSFYFEPNRIVVKQNVPVDLHLSKKSLFVPHRFFCNYPEAGIQVNVSVGALGFLPGSKTVTFTPTQPGTYGFACNKDKHEMKGMSGTIVVEP